MKYFSNDQIQESLKVLAPYNVFFSTTFLVMKKEQVPIGGEKDFSLDAANRSFLQTHFQIHPKSRHFFRVMRPNSRAKDWLAPNYASTGLQSINTQTFRDAIIHEPIVGGWGWSEDYVKRLSERLPKGRGKIPLYHLAVWLYKFEAWDDETTSRDIISRIITDYDLTDEEIEALFEESVVLSLSDGQSFQRLKVEVEDLLSDYSLPDDVPLETSGILQHLESSGVGPISSLVFRPAERLNVITGDNGLGKTFLLDLAWWALTQDWAERRATPFAVTPLNPPEIKYSVAQRVRSRPITAQYEFETGDWIIRESRPSLSGIVVYAQLDGSFAVWDPANRSLADSSGRGNRWPGLKFTRDQIWNGKDFQIEGLIRDWIKWQQSPDRYPAFKTFQAVLRKVYPPDLGRLSIGEPSRVWNDSREIPTLRHPYGTVPILFESAGLRRILTLTYLLVWVWEEHRVHAKQQGRSEERQMVVLIDEVEAHLHPRWQRVILPALLEVARELGRNVSAQWIVASHSPLVLASAEGTWDAETDRLFHLDLSEAGDVKFDDIEFNKRGTIDSWLSSDIFELSYPGSTGREEAIQEAVRLQMLTDPSEEQVRIVTDKLLENLAAEDPFWVRWIFFAEQFGVQV